MRLSDDCHSYNIQLKFHPTYQFPSTSPIKNVQNPELVLQVMKPIEAGQELLLWFSEDVLAMLQVAFLTPANIQGKLPHFLIEYKHIHIFFHFNCMHT